VVFWRTHDVHNTRPYATLTTPRAARIADVAKVNALFTSNQCTVCHAPIYFIPPTQRVETLSAKVGLSCENCHGPAAAWLRTHTRPDFTHADRVAAGMRDLRNLYQRANACVACHQNLDREILEARHPRLLFELDGQLLHEPKHWRESTNWHGAQAWLVGQAVALREMSWQLEHPEAVTPEAVAQWRGLHWVLQKAGETDSTLPALNAVGAELTAQDFKRCREVSDRFAQQVAALQWTRERTEQLLRKLAGAADELADAKTSQTNQAYRAERLVLGLDRLLASLGKKDSLAAADEQLNGLFKMVQVLPELKTTEFANGLKRFERSLK
jgi:Zn-finger protein